MGRAPLPGCRGEGWPRCGRRGRPGGQDGKARVRWWNRPVARPTRSENSNARPKPRAGLLVRTLGVGLGRHGAAAVLC